MKRILILSLLLSAVFVQAQEQLIDQMVGIVGDEIVLQSDIEAQKLQLVQQGYPNNSELDCLVAEDLLIQSLLVNQARIDSLEVGEDEVNQTIDRRLAYYIDLVGGEKAFVDYYGKSIAQFREDFEEPIKKQLLAQRMQDNINSEGQVTPSEVRDYYNSIPADSLPLINESVMYSKIVMEPKVTAAARNEARNFLDSIRTAVAEGEISMFTAAAIHSEDPGSKYKGGCYENIPKGQFDPAYEAAVYKTPVGEFTPVFESTFGFHFVEVKDVRGQTFSSCHVLRIPKINADELEISRVRMDSLYTVLKADSLTFIQAANRFSTEEESANSGGIVVNPQTGDTRHEVRNLDPKLFFALDKLKEGEFSEPVLKASPDGTKQSYVIYRLDKRIAAHEANLQDDYQLIQGAAQGDKRNNLMNEWVAEQLKATYVRMYAGFEGCTFQYDWNSEQASK